MSCWGDDVTGIGHGKTRFQDGNRVLPRGSRASATKGRLEMPQMHATRPEWYNRHSRGKRRPPRNRKERMRAALPYGIWTCADGRQVLFNRFYDPIWSRYPGQPATAADPNEWVHWQEQEWFFDDGNTPWGSWNGREH